MPGSYLERALDYIECHLAEAPTIEEVARATGVTAEQLRAAFLLILCASSSRSGCIVTSLHQSRTTSRQPPRSPLSAAKSFEADRVALPTLELRAFEGRVKIVRAERRGARKKFFTPETVYTQAQHSNHSVSGSLLNMQ